MKNILSYTCTEFTDQFLKGRDHARAIYSSWMRKGSVPVGEKWFREGVSRSDFWLPRIVRSWSDGGVEKLLLELHDLKRVETVIIPMKFGFSLCVSSQVGCRMGCTFCQTGRMGLVRHLAAEEIVSQLFVAKHLVGKDIRNIVFMGMGEPFDNFDAVHQAIKIFCDPLGFGLAKRHITISTSGRLDGIERMRLEMDPAIRLALSVNAPNDAVRKKVMPLTRKYSMGALKEGLLKYCQDPRRTLLAEYVLLKGITDSLEAADELADYLDGLPARVNLIPYNPQATDRYERPDEMTLKAFKSRLQSHGLHVLLRLTKGDDIMAACGQLGAV